MKPLLLPPDFWRSGYVNDIIIILLAGFTTGITTVLFGFGGGFIVVPFVYHIVAAEPGLSPHAMHIAVATSTAVMIFNAGWATIQSGRAGRLNAAVLFPLVWFIAAGAVGGSLLAGLLKDEVVRVLFILYLIITLADCVMRKGFINRPQARRLSGTTVGFGGIFIGVVAALLGVGGSVMTVPLLRRHGYEMRDCVSAANPLSIPVAVCGAVTYTLTGWHAIPAPGYSGFISMKILVLLTASGFCGMLFTRRCIPAVPDVLHARIYVALLLAVLLAMAV